MVPPQQQQQQEEEQRFPLPDLSAAPQIKIGFWNTERENIRSVRRDAKIEWYFPRFNHPPSAFPQAELRAQNNKAAAFFPLYPNVPISPFLLYLLLPCPDGKKRRKKRALRCGPPPSNPPLPLSPRLINLFAAHAVTTQKKKGIKGKTAVCSSFLAWVKFANGFPQ